MKKQEDPKSIRESAFGKLDEFVKGELQYLVDNKYPLKMFNIDNMLPDNLDEDEKEEVKNSILQLKEGAVMFYCKCRGIDIPGQLMKKVINESENNSDEKEPTEKKRELLTSKRTLKPGQQILND